ncbi:PREDICTED: GDP-fucose protein O-fucosyltransferase 1-like [Priapulus caudatus]|uniref:GDP-fucose protein O-fucosyltransferase 1 n=1 Tax=Priapulus caudatus TaxID=37621 RepID=A0ABM1F5I2_PRICU|nr:PREDICTED: GDP-fucose protein O-fucosyltransferase 1-like [Priapulus caudatus]
MRQPLEHLLLPAICLAMLLSSDAAGCTDAASSEEKPAACGTDAAADEDAAGGGGQTCSQRERESCPRPDIDPSGYLIFCLCMGRFGNKVDHFLGGLAWAKRVNRTLVLPPWLSAEGSAPYETLFSVDAVRRYHRVITADDFMRQVAPLVWPPEKRVGMCYVRNHGDDCKMVHGQPFGSFWRALGIEFVREIPYTFTYHATDAFNATFPPSRYPILALKGAPASYPVNAGHRDLQRHLVWSDEMAAEGRAHVLRLFGGHRFVGVHLRNNYDWERACAGVHRYTNYMSSSQCLGDRPPVGAVTAEMCLPSPAEVVRATRRAAIAADAKFVYVASDRDPMLAALREGLADLSAQVVHLDRKVAPVRTEVDLVVLAMADHFVGNCVSSFTAFVKRERDVRGKPSSFFGIDE